MSFIERTKLLNQVAEKLDEIGIVVEKFEGSNESDSFNLQVYVDLRKFNLTDQPVTDIATQTSYKFNS